MIDLPFESEIEVWWIPQIPMEPFTYVVDSIETGKAMLDMLALYDLFQLDNNIKPDYSNAGGLRWKHQGCTGGQWLHLFEEDIND